VENDGPLVTLTTVCRVMTEAVFQGKRRVVTCTKYYMSGTSE